MLGIEFVFFLCVLFILHNDILKQQLNISEKLLGVK